MEKKEKDLVAKSNKNNAKKKGGFFSFFGNMFKGIGKWFKECFSEMKKVSWPTFPKVIKNLGVVLVLVLIFLVVISVFDFGLQELLKLLQGV